MRRASATPLPLLADLHLRRIVRCGDTVDPCAELEAFTKQGDGACLQSLCPCCILQNRGSMCIVDSQLVYSIYLYLRKCTLLAH